MEQANCKCSCCGSSELSERVLSIAGPSNGWIRVNTGDYRYATVNQARVCKQCGNIMPFVDPSKIVDNPLPWMS